MRAFKGCYKHTNTNTNTTMTRGWTSFLGNQMTRGDRLVNVLHKTIQWIMMRGKTID